MTVFPSCPGRLAILAIRSRAALAVLLLALSLAATAAAHEIRPAIAVVEVRADSVEVTLEAAVEALVADLDLAGLQNTDEAEAAESYDALRVLDSATLEARLRDAWPRIAASMTLRAGERELTPRLGRVHIPPVGNADLPRISTLVLGADLPADDSAVVFGWPAAYGPVVVRQGDDEAGYSAYLADGGLSDPLPRDGAAGRGWVATFVDYVAIGLAVVVPGGLDHILFILGLVFLSPQSRPLIYQVAAFALAHSAALALATLGLVSVRDEIVAPLIAASIVYVAVDNIAGGRMGPVRPAIVFGFGVLHGLGFASDLGGVGLNPAHVVSGLAGFNIGLEIGLLSVIAAAFLLVGVPFGRMPWYRERIAVPASVGIGIVGAWWVVERTLL